MSPNDSVENGSSIGDESTNEDDESTVASEDLHNVNQTNPDTSEQG